MLNNPAKIIQPTWSTLQITQAEPKPLTADRQARFLHRNSKLLRKVKYYSVHRSSRGSGSTERRTSGCKQPNFATHQAIISGPVFKKSILGELDEYVIELGTVRASLKHCMSPVYRHRTDVHLSYPASVWTVVSKRPPLFADSARFA